jgi:hypothetical protein
MRSLPHTPPDPHMSLTNRSLAPPPPCATISPSDPNHRIDLLLRAPREGYPDPIARHELLASSHDAHRQIRANLRTQLARPCEVDLRAEIRRRNCGVVSRHTIYRVLTFALTSWPSRWSVPRRWPPHFTPALAATSESIFRRALVASDRMLSSPSACPPNRRKEGRRGLRRPDCRFDLAASALRH